MRNSKRIIIIGLIILTVILGAVVTGYSKSGNRFFGIGKESKRIYDQEQENEKARKIVIEADGVKISSGQVAIKSMFLEQSLGRKPSREEIIKSLTKEAAMAKEADRRGVSISEIELKEYMEMMRKSFEDLKGSEKSQYVDLLRGLGYTEDNFWESEYAREGSKRALKVVKLREAVLEEAPPEIRGDYEKEWEYFEERMEDLADETKTEVLDESVFND